MQLNPISNKYIYFTRMFYQASGSDKQDDIYLTAMCRRIDAYIYTTKGEQSELQQIIDSFTGPFESTDKNKLQTKLQKPINEKEARTFLKQCSNKIIALFNVLKVDYTEQIQTIIENFRSTTVESSIVSFGERGLVIAQKMYNQTRDFRRTGKIASQLITYFRQVKSGKKPSYNLQSLIYNFTMNLVKDLAEEFNKVKILYQYLIVIYGKAKATQIAYRQLKKKLTKMNDYSFQYTSAAKNDRKNSIQNFPKVSNVQTKLVTDGDTELVFSLHFNAQSNLYKSIKKLYGIFHTNLEIPDLPLSKEDLFTPEFRYRYANMAEYQVLGSLTQTEDDIEYKTPVEPANRALANEAVKALALLHHIKTNQLGRFFYGRDEQVHSISEILRKMEVEIPRERPWSKPYTILDTDRSYEPRVEAVLMYIHKINV